MPNKFMSNNPLHEARQQGALIRTQNNREEMIGRLLFLFGIVGFVAFVWLIVKIYDHTATAYIWDVDRWFANASIKSRLINTAMYLFAYFFVVGIAFTTLYNIYEEKIDNATNLICSFWILFTAIIVLEPLIEVMQRINSFLAGNLLGWLCAFIWFGWGYASFQLLKHLPKKS